MWGLLCDVQMHGQRDIPIHSTPLSLCLPNPLCQHTLLASMCLSGWGSEARCAGAWCTGLTGESSCSEGRGVVMSWVGHRSMPTNNTALRCYPMARDQGVLTTHGNIGCSLDRILQFDQEKYCSQVTPDFINESKHVKATISYKFLTTCI